jgi:N-carbamoyl-L-amino-acid hydrolase
LSVARTPIDASRLWGDIMALADITDPDRPYTRRSFTPLFLQGRAWLKQRFVQAGLDVRMDSAGNLIGRRNGLDPRCGVIAVGSHSDTVPSGGRFDGVAGLAAALEIARALHDADVQLRHSLEVIDFLAEEPSEFGLSCVGSRGISGALTSAMLDLIGPGGERMSDALRRVGGDPDRLDAAKRSDIRAFLELHIEQGVVLERQSIDVGIVTSIVGIRRIEIVFDGAADHAGTTPLALRKDALLAAAGTVVSVRRAAEQLSGSNGQYFVATVGILDVEPSASNIVPGRCRLMIDARSTDAALTARFVEVIERESAAHAVRANVTRSPLRILSDTPPVVCDPRLLDILRKSARALGFNQIDLASGAGHDAAFMSRICSSAMVFVPCRSGKSHAPEEWANRDQIAAGAAAMLDAVRAIDRAFALT